MPEYVVDEVSFNPHGSGWRPGDMRENNKVKELNRTLIETEGGGIMTDVCNRRAADGWTLLTAEPGMDASLLLFFSRA